MEKAEKVFPLCWSPTSARKWSESKRSVLSAAATSGDPVAQVFLCIMLLLKEQVEAFPNLPLPVLPFLLLIFEQHLTPFSLLYLALLRLSI